MNKKTLRIAGWALGLSMAVAGIGVAAGAFSLSVNSIGSTMARAAEEAAYTLTPASGSNNSYAGNCDVTINDIAWNVEGNAQQIPWRIGGKSLSGVDRAVYSKTAMGSPITKVELTVGAASSITVNSLKLIAASDADFKTTIDEVSGTFNANSTITFTPTNGTEWAKDAYYKFVFNVTVSGSNNKFVEFSNATFYKEAAAASPLESISLSGSYKTIFEKGEDFNHDGMVVTANYESGSSKDVTASAEFSGYNASVAGNQTITVSYTESEITKETTYNINVKEITNVVLNGDMSKKSYHNGDDWNVGGLYLTVSWSAGDPTSVLLVDLTKGTDYSFDKDTASEGNTSLEITGSYGGFDFSKTITGISVSAAPDTLNKALTGASGTTYSNWSGKNGSSGSGAVYAGNTAGGNDSIQMRNSSPSGIWTTESGGIFDGIEVSWNSHTADDRRIDIYGKNTAYESGDLYNDSNKGTLLGSISKSDSTLSGNFDDYEYIGIKASGALYLDEINIFWAPTPELDSVSTSGQTVSFTQGDTFEYEGTLTASYTLGKDDATVEPTSFKIGDDDIDPGNDGTAIDAETVMDVETHNGKYIYVGYTEKGITKWTEGYQITVSYASVTGVELDAYEGSISLGETFTLSNLDVDVNPSNTNPNYTWALYDDGGLVINEDYTFDGNVFRGLSDGVVVFRCTSDLDNSKYADFTLTITGNPIVSLPGTVELYTGKTTNVTASVEGGTPGYSYAWSITSGNANATIEGGTTGATVTLSGVSAGSVTLQCVVTDSASKSTTESVTFTVIESAVTEINWDASDFDVFSGATIPADIDDAWMVNYTKNNGDSDYLTFGQYKLYLGDDEIESLPYTFQAADDGKKLHAEYGDISSPLINVAVTQTINAVAAINTADWSHTIEAKTWSASGSQTISGKTWSMTGTGKGYFGYDATKGQQFGSGSNPYSALTLSSADFSQEIDSVDVYTSGANGISATVQVSVGGTAYGDAKSISSTNSKYTFDLGGKSGQVSINWDNTSEKAIYVKQIVVNYVTGSEDIANSSSHKAAQKIAVKYANAFNAAMDITANCTTNMSSAWSTAASAFEAFEEEAAELDAQEEAYARNLIKYATIVNEWPDDFGDSGCIERMVKVYKVCVESHGMTAFMSEVRPDISAAAMIPSHGFGGINDNAGLPLVITIASVGAAAAGGIFFLARKRRNED